MITLICGLPRAGKTTFSKRYENVIHLDSCGSYRIVLQHIINRQDDVVVEGVYRNHDVREVLAKSYAGDGRRCIWLDTPNEIRQSRKGWDKSCDIPPFEPPTLEEGWDEIIIMRGDEIERISRQTET